MNCTKGMHYGVCRVANKTCESLNLSQKLTFTMNDYDFTIPLENIAVYVNQTDKHTHTVYFCQTQIALLAQSDKAVVLGAAFYTAFTGMFDTENDKIGFAESTRALPGSSIQYSKEAGKKDPVTPVGPDGPPSHHSKSSGNAKIILIILALVILVVLIICGTVWWRRRAERNKDNT